MNQGKDMFVQKLAGAVFIMIIMSVLGWIGVTVLKTDKAIGLSEIRSELQLEAIYTALSALEKQLVTRTDQRWRKSDAELAHIGIANRIMFVDNKVVAIDKRVVALERSLEGTR